MVGVRLQEAIPQRASIHEVVRHSKGVHGKRYKFGIICPDGGMVDTEVSKSSALRCAGSSPALGTSIEIKNPYNLICMDFFNRKNLKMHSPI